MTAPRMMGSWTIPALLAGCVLFGMACPAAAAWPPAPRETLFQLAQADTTSQPGDEEDEEDVPIPPNLLDTTPPPGFPKEASPDTTGAAAARDSTRLSLPAAPETLRYVQPGGTPGTGAKPGQVVGAAAPPKPRSALFGLGPAVIILGLAVIHFLVLRTVGG